MPRYLIKRRRRWYAILEVPEKLREHFGKDRFKKSLETESLTEAETLVLPVIARWKAEIEEARTGKPQTAKLYSEWLKWADDYRNSSGEERQTLDFVLSDMVEDAEYTDPNKASALLNVVTGSSVPLGSYIEQWISTLTDEPKTKDMKRSVANEFSRDFQFTHQVNRQAVKVWAHKLLNPEDLSKRQAKKTVQRKLSFLGRYWAFLQSAGYVKGEEEPFRNAMESAKRDKTKAGTKRGWVALRNEEAVAALDRATEKGDHSLAALIWLGMWTGCRIEELCSLEVSKVFEDRIVIVDAKTEAGDRELPIHSSLSRAVRLLTITSYDGYLISGLTKNKYGDRSNAMGKRFGRLMDELKMGDRKVFHSLRKTVVTQLENAGVPSGFVADLVGHEKASFTFGVYSAGTLFEKKREAIEHLSYPLEREYQFTNREVASRGAIPAQRLPGGRHPRVKSEDTL